MNRLGSLHSWSTHPDGRDTSAGVADFYSNDSFSEANSGRCHHRSYEPSERVEREGPPLLVVSTRVAISM